MKKLHLVSEDFNDVDYICFFAGLSEGAVFVYSNSFLFEDIQLLAKKHGVELVYCEPDSKEYKEHGCNTVKVESVRKMAYRPVI